MRLSTLLKLLLDTHTFLFAINPVERLSARVRDLLEDPETERTLSTVSLAEIAIKTRIGKLDLPANREFYLEHMAALEAKILNIEFDHTMALMHLPLLHRDPFDRLLVAQAKAEGLTLVTRDSRLAGYGIDTLW